MTKINPIFEAIGNINDDIAANAIEITLQKRKPIKLVIIGAIAAALIITGCSAAIRSSLMFDSKAAIGFNYYPQTQSHILSAEELNSLGASENNGSYLLNILPSELFDLYNISPLMNYGNFSEEKSEITVRSSSTQTILNYSLTDKETSNTITVEIQFDTDGRSSFGADYISLDGNAADMFSNCEFITLSDGSRAFVSDRYLHGYEYYTAQAVLCYNGIGYKISARNTDINEMKQILANLGAMQMQ